MNLKSALTFHREPVWSPAPDDHVTLFDENELEPLGTIRNRVWYRHARYGDLVEGRRYRRDEDPGFGYAAETVTDDGKVQTRTFSAYPWGRFAAEQARPARVPKPAKPHRPVDRLGLAWLAQRQPERIVVPPSPATRIVAEALPDDDRKLGDGTYERVRTGHRRERSPYIKPPQPPARGPAAIIARLETAGAVVSLAADGQHLVVTASGGTPSAGVVELVELTERLLVGHLRGDPVACEVGVHETPEPAISIVLGGAAACTAHLAGVSNSMEEGAA